MLNRQLLIISVIYCMCVFSVCLGPKHTHALLLKIIILVHFLIFLLISYRYYFSAYYVYLLLTNESTILQHWLMNSKLYSKDFQSYSVSPLVDRKTQNESESINKVNI